MELNAFKKYIPIGGIIAVVSIVLLGGLLLYRASIFHVISVNPPTNNFPAVSPFFDIHFSKPLVARSLHLAGSGHIISSYLVVGKDIEITLNEPLVIGSSYVITVESVNDTKGAVVHNKSYHFVARDIASNQLPQDVQQALLKRQTDYAKAAYSDPILKYLPHNTLTYNLTTATSVENGKTVLTVSAQLLLSNADVNTDEAGAISQYKQEVLDYLTSVGINPGKYNIVFTTNQ